MRRFSVKGVFCRTCGTAVNRTMTSKTLVLGWWGVFSVLITPFVLVNNVVQHFKIRRLAPPKPGFQGRPLNPGRPVLLRAEVLALAIPLALATMITVIAISAIPPDPKVGDCVTRTESDAAEVVPCTSPKARYRVLARFDGGSSLLCQNYSRATMTYTDGSMTLCLRPVP